VEKWKKKRPHKKRKPERQLQKNESVAQWALLQVSSTHSQGGYIHQHCLVIYVTDEHCAEGALRETVGKK